MHFCIYPPLSTNQETKQNVFSPIRKDNWILLYPVENLTSINSVKKLDPHHSAFLLGEKPVEYVPTNQRRELDISAPIRSWISLFLLLREKQSGYFSVNQKLNNNFTTNEESTLDVFHQSETRSRYFSTNGKRQAGCFPLIRNAV